jgi:hypothetical protein
MAEMRMSDSGRVAGRGGCAKTSGGKLTIRGKFHTIIASEDVNITALRGKDSEYATETNWLPFYHLDADGSWPLGPVAPITAKGKNGYFTRVTISAGDIVAYFDWD